MPVNTVAPNRWWTLLAATCWARHTIDDVTTLTRLEHGDQWWELRSLLTYLFDGEPDTSNLWDRATHNNVGAYIAAARHLPEHVVDNIVDWVTAATPVGGGAEAGVVLARRPDSSSGTLARLHSVVTDIALAQPAAARWLPDTMSWPSLENLGANILANITDDTGERTLHTSARKPAAIGAAQNTHAPPALLAKIAENCTHHNQGNVAQRVLHHIASNPSTPGDTLSQLAFTPHRDAVLANPSTPGDLLATMYADMLTHFQTTTSGAWSALLRNPSLPEPVIAAALETSDRSAWHLQIYANPAVTLEQRQHGAHNSVGRVDHTHWAIAANPAVTLDELNSLASGATDEGRHMRRCQVDNTWDTWSTLTSSLFGDLSAVLAKVDVYVTVPEGLPDLNATQVATMLRLAPEWAGDIGDLIDTARDLTDR